MLANDSYNTPLSFEATAIDASVVGDFKYIFLNIKFAEKFTNTDPIFKTISKNYSMPIAGAHFITGKKNHHLSLLSLVWSRNYHVHLRTRPVKKLQSAGNFRPKIWLFVPSFRLFKKIIQYNFLMLPYDSKFEYPVIKLIAKRKSSS